MEKHTFTTGEVAYYCGVNFRTVIRWIKRGHLKAFQLPGRGDNRIEHEELIRFLNAHNIPLPDELKGSVRRVLIVEDELSTARAIERVLRKAGFKTAIAVDGFCAGFLLGTFGPGVITLDLKLPGLSGLDVLEHLRKSKNWKDIPILVGSAMPEEELHKALAAGANDVLKKPFDGDTLLEKVSCLVNISECAR